MLICGLIFVMTIMCCKNFWKTIFPFALAVGFGLLAVNLLQKENLIVTRQEKGFIKVVPPQTGTGSSGSDTGLSPFYTSNSPQFCYLKSDSIQIRSKPRPKYTDTARQNQVQGKVMLRVTFLASGQIGKISPITNLPDGLTEEAIAVAKLIKFKPQMRNKKPITITKTVEYNFILY